jgi:hypothetical protein
MRLGPSNATFKAAAGRSDVTSAELFRKPFLQGQDGHGPAGGPSVSDSVFPVATGLTVSWQQHLGSGAAVSERSGQAIRADAQQHSHGLAAVASVR